jgi:autotransporter-associated beta strand protein
VQLVNTVRGPYASGNPSKYAYQYPRPWRLNLDSQVVPTGAVDALGFPVYDSPVTVVPQLLRQRSTSPVDDGGFPSGHTNAFYLAALALAYAIPERFQELVACASDLAHTRIVAGMHSPVDVVGGRVLGTALAAAALHDPANATLKTAARAQAAAYLQPYLSTIDSGPYADRAANARLVYPRLTYILPRHGDRTPMTVPVGAEVLLETRLPYLDADQRREVLRTTALPAGYVLLDGPEMWGRLNLFAAADGYGAFDADVVVTIDTADTWRNDIGGTGGLVKRGTGTLALTGTNRYSGGTRIAAGTLGSGSAAALGHGDVEVSGGTLRLDPVAGGVRVRGGYRQAGATLEVTLGAGREPALAVDCAAVLGTGAALLVHAGSARSGATVPVIRAGWLRGRFGTVTVDVPGYRAVPVYTDTGVFVRLVAA